MKYYNLIKFLLTWGKNDYTAVLFDEEQYKNNYYYNQRKIYEVAG